jgi:Flp pilus assembly protein TadD
VKAVLITYRPILICIALAAATLIAFEPLRYNSFVDLDDTLYVTENPNIKNGLSLQSVLWAFTHSHAAFWHPLTSLSHILDCELFDLNPLGHHITSLLLHIANTLLLFMAMQNMTNAVWQSAFVAAVFALHPLHVESVAWVSERKDVLSGFFWMLTIIAYLHYLKNPNIKRYLLTLLSFILGLMSKPMVVTLPFVLLLLDYWPLKRTENPKLGIAHLVLEKVPFFVLSAAAAVIAFLFQQKEGALPDVNLLPINTRIANALISYISYLTKTFWPDRLAVFYPYPADTIPIWQALFSFLLLLGLSVLVVRLAKNHKYLPVGWFWYLGTLLPVIGLVQVGTHSMADRYTYLPLIGIFIIIAWGAAELFAKWRFRKIALSIFASAIFTALVVLTRTQVKYWHDSVTLFEHTVRVTNNNYTIDNNLGVALQARGRLDEAISHFRMALQSNPEYFNAYYNLANALKAQGKLDEAVSYYYQALKIKPDDAGVHNNLGTALQARGRLDDAVDQYQKALQIQPDLPSAHNNLGSIFLMQRKPDDAVVHLRQALLLNPENPETYYNLSIALQLQGNLEQAITAAQKALDLALAAKNNDLVRKIRSQLELYKHTKP